MRIGVEIWWASFKYEDKYEAFNSYEEMFNYLRQLHDSFVIKFLSENSDWDTINAFRKMLVNVICI